MNQKRRIISNLSSALDVNLLLLAHNSIGVLNYKNSHTSGEEYFLRKILSKEIKEIKSPIIFDVGANTGKYVKSIINVYPSAEVYGFEPNPVAFSQLKTQSQDFQGVQVFNHGFGKKDESTSIFTYRSEQASSHASIYSSVITDLHNRVDLHSIDIQLKTIDEFCRQHSIGKIDFLKIDTEGHEYAVLEGAESMIAQKRIRVIQFEFNEMNVVSRVFLQDFYKLLSSYNIYRINTTSLVPLGSYSASNEIFQFQNLVAILN